MASASSGCPRSVIRRPAVGSALLLGSVVAIVLGTSAVPRAAPSLSLSSGAGQRGSAYVDDRACAGCHRSEYQRWSGSHHAKAMQRADDSTVLGDFNNARFVHRGTVSRFFKREGKFFVNTEGPDGKAADFAIEYTFGVEPLQQYLVALPGGRLQALTTAWDIRRRRWFSLDPPRKIVPGNPRHWTGRYQNWNLMCAECHVTNFRKGYAAATDAYESAWDGPSVGCQACHGPGGTHVERATSGVTGPDTQLPVSFRRGSARLEVDSCARCHSRRVRLADDERPGRPLLDEWSPEVLRAGLYQPDGQQQGEVYEYGSFLQSGMYARGVRCSDCHEPHAGKLRRDGNALCTGCHGPTPDRRFPGLIAREYDSPVHHFHTANSSAGRCVSCHMPARAYMVVDPRRDHSFPVPRPDLTAKLGTPNACTACHSDRPARWAAAAMRRWYGPAALRMPHYAEPLAAGRARARDAAPDLIALVGDFSQPAIVRATALDLLRGYGSAAVAALVTATKDEDPLVRAAAVSGLDNLPPRQRVGPAAPLLSDPIRAVRVAAARALASTPPELLRGSDRHAFDRALSELLASHGAMADMPSAQTNLGVLHERLGRPDLARRSYTTALRMDPSLVPARINLAALLDGAGRNADAERTLRAGLSLIPASGELHYSLGLVLAEAGRLADAAGELQAAARLLPGRPRIHYNHGLTLEQLGRPRSAEAALRRAHALDPADPDVVYALAALNLRQGHNERAMIFARRLAELAPEDPRAGLIVDRATQKRSTGRPAK
jgi:predicted CXXCH cytochrome family protein